MKKRFIVLIDFSNHSEWLLTFSYNWALQADAELILVHRVTQPLPGLGDAQVLSEMKRDSEKKIIEKLKSFAEGIGGTAQPIKYHADSYSVSSAVARLQEPDTIDFLFVGMHDKSDIEKLVSPGTAIQLSNEIHSTIIALPTSAFDFDSDTLYIAIKHSYPLDETHFENLLSIMAGRVKHLHFFSIVKPGADRSKITAYLEHICSKYKRMIQVAYQISESNHPTEAIKEYMHERNSILVVQKGTRGFMDIFRKFFTTDIVHHAQIPIIILP